MKNDAFHMLWYANLYLYKDLMESEINTNTNGKANCQQHPPTTLSRPQRLRAISRYMIAIYFVTSRFKVRGGFFVLICFLSATML
jgi:hypothetical protein